MTNNLLDAACRPDRLSDLEVSLRTSSICTVIAGEFPSEAPDFENSIRKPSLASPCSPDTIHFSLFAIHTMKLRILSTARLSFPLASAIAALLAAPSLHAVNGNWNVDAAGNWSTAASWSSTPTVPGTVAGDVIGLNNNISAARTVTIDTTGRTAGTLNVGDSNNTHVFTLAASGGGTLTFNNSGSGAQINETGSQIDVISAQIVLADNLAVSAAGSITLSTGGITETGGARTLTKSGAGLLTLSGANSYTGLTTVSAGVLNIQNATSLGGVAGGTTVASGAVLQIQNNITVGAEALSLSGEGIATVVTSLHGTGSTASGALRIISGNNTYGGAITLGAASRINSDTLATTLTLTGGITGTNLNLTVGGIGNTTVSTTGITTGSGSLIKDNFGTLTLSAANSYTGTTTVLGGTLAVAREAALYNGNSSEWTAANINAKAGATVALNVDPSGTSGFTDPNLNTLLGNISVANTAAQGLQAGAFVGIDTTNAGGSFTPTFAFANSTGAFGGVIGLTKLGTGTLVLDLANTYTGPTTVSAGTLQLGSGGTSGTLSTSSPITVASGAVFAINRSDIVTQGTEFSAAPITGAGGFTQAGGGTTVLTAANTFTGTTTVSSGVLQLDNALALQNSALSTSGTGTVVLGAGVTVPAFGGVSGSTALATVIPAYNTVTNLILNPQSGVTATYSGVVSDGSTSPLMTLSKTGAGTQVLTGVNTYTGTTIINGGTLRVGDGLTGSLNGTTGTALTFTGTGIFNVAEAAGSTQGMGALTLSAGDATVTSTAFDGLSPATLTFGSLAVRPAGATGNFTLVNNTTSSNQIVFTDTTNVPLAAGSNDPGLFFGGSNYARYDATGAGRVRAVTYGTDTNANAALTGAQTTLGTIGAAIDARYTGSSAATANSTAVAQNAVTVLNVLDGTAFREGQAITGTNITGNTFIVSISGNALTLNQATGNVAASTVITPRTVVSAQTTDSLNTLNLDGNGASLRLASGQTLSVNGILRSGGAANVVGAISGGTGIQTVASGGELVVRTNIATNDVLNINTPILDNGGSRLTISGSGILVLSAANTYTGGTFISGGLARITNAASFGTNTNVTVTGNSQITATGGITYANAIAVNAGQTLTLLNPATGSNSTAEFTGVLSGSGNLFLPNSGTNAIQGILAFTNTANTFTGNVVLSPSTSGDEHFRFASLGDGGNFTFAKNGNRQLITYTGSTDITFNTRQIVVAATMFGTTDRQGMDGGGSNPVNIFQNDGTGAITFTKDIVVNNLTSHYGVLYFGGTNSGDNTLSGNISDTSGSPKFAIGKFGTGKWILSGTNTYEGNTLIANGTLSVGTIANSSIPQPLGIGPAFQLGVGNAAGSNGTLLYTGGTASTDKQVQIGPNAANAPAGTNSGGIVNDGTGALTFTNPTFNPTTTGVTGTRTLTLGGSYTGGTNTVQGIIQNNATAGVVAVTKTGAGTWQLSGANTYTGATTLTGGTLILSGSNSSAAATTIGTGGGTLQLDSSSNGGLASGSLNLNSATAVIQALNADRSISNSVVMNGDLGSAPTFSGANSITLTGNLRVNNAAVTLTNNIDSGEALTINTIDRDGANSRNLTVEGTGETIVGGAIALSGGSLTKNGAGAMTLSGVNTYTGSTVVNAGSLTLTDNAQLSFVLGASGINNSITGAGTVTLDGDFSITTTAADGLNAGTWILENVDTLITAYGPNFTVGSGFSDIGGDQWRKTVGSKIYTFDETTGTLTLFTPDPFPAWAASKGLDGTPGFENGKGDDPDGDGFTNLDEFAFDGNPLSGANDGKIVGKIATVGADQVMTLTLPVRNGATFANDGGDQLSALTDGIYYRVEGSLDLSVFANTVTEVTPAITAGLPALSSGWTYRTFRAPGTVPTVSRTFLRVNASETP